MEGEDNKERLIANTNYLPHKNKQNTKQKLYINTLK